MRFGISAAVVATAFCVAGAAAQGPISKFGEKAPVAEYRSASRLEDIERCLIDMEGWLAPNVYRQPDRPDQVTLLWIAGGMYAGKAAARVDLVRDGAGTRVKSWMPAKQARACAPA
jgi:hypothetical protein